jgi:hypothetical protein
MQVPEMIVSNPVARITAELIGLPAVTG